MLYPIQITSIPNLGDEVSLISFFKINYVGFFQDTDLGDPGVPNHIMIILQQVMMSLNHIIENRNHITKNMNLITKNLQLITKTLLHSSSKHFIMSLNHHIIMSLNTK